MKQYCICLLLLLPIFFKTSAQNIIRCNTTGYEDLLKIRFPAYRKARINMEELILQKKNNSSRLSADAPLVTIPVVVHVLFNSSTSNISIERINSQIKVLNEDYARLNADTTETPTIYKAVAGKANFRFVLANRDPNGNISTGILRKYVSNKSFLVDNYMDDSILKSVSRWPSDRYLNIWVTTLSNNQNNKVLGYTFNPSSYALPDLYSDIEAALDGVVVDYTTFGVINSTSKYNLGRTTTHEVGHWLGLRHIWGDDFCGNDYVTDTPLQEGSNLNLTKDFCAHFSNCNGTSNLDMSGNYMDYSPDKCMNIFTKGQVERMITVMQTNDRRVKIQSSTGYCDLPYTASLPIFQGFENTLITSDWSFSNPGNNNTFELVDQGAFSKSENSMFIDNSMASSAGAVDYYYSVPITFANTSKPVLEFDIACATSAGGQTDSLVVSYNSNCQDYIPLASYFGASLTTRSGSVNFTPEAADWKTINLPLPTFTNKIAQIRFEIYSKGVSKLYLDNINLYDATNNLQVVLYPNPVRDFVLTAEIFYKEIPEVQFYIYSSQGKHLRTIQVNNKDFRKKLDVSGLATGIYILKTIVADKVLVRRFLVEQN